ncbi:MAG: hypothetical protein MR412_00405 [Firmicutes bacterium]|nr:hypothetical protein [Bacillota bacterium]MDY5676668.1 hypothetical protein [Eubacteriales bacterium]
MREKNTKKIPAPVKLLLCIADRGIGKDIENYLNDHELKGGLLILGKGTAESDIADIFGFGLSDKDIVGCLIPINKLDKVVEDINQITGVETDRYGLNMILDIQSMASNMLEFLNIKVG